LNAGRPENVGFLCSTRYLLVRLHVRTGCNGRGGCGIGASIPVERATAGWGGSKTRRLCGHGAQRAAPLHESRGSTGWRWGFRGRGCRRCGQSWGRTRGASFPSRRIGRRSFLRWGAGHCAAK